MTTEKNLLVSLLKLTKNTQTTNQILTQETKISKTLTTNYLKKYQAQGLLSYEKDQIYLNQQSRLLVAIKAIELGADIENTSSLLDWKEFENLTSIALTKNNYQITTNLHFTNQQKRWQIDVIGLKKPAVICIDCKHYHRGFNLTNLTKIVQNQTQRTQALCQTLPNKKIDLECTTWKKAIFIPVIMSLIPHRKKFVNNTPIVPILQIQDFLNQLPAKIQNITHFTKDFYHIL